MPASFIILPKRNLIYLRITGFARVQDSLDGMHALSQHPLMRPTMNHIADYSGVTDFERNYVRIFSLQAQIAAEVVDHATEFMLAQYVQTPLQCEMAGMVVKSWEGVSSVVPRVFDDGAEMLRILGQPERDMNAFRLAAEREGERASFDVANAGRR